jgi:hypothetical protein
MNFHQSLLAISIGVVVLLYLGAGSSSIVQVPGYAVAYLDDTNKTYLTLPCVDQWQKTPTHSVDVLRQALVADAYKLGYRMDEDCREAGGFIDDDRSLTGFLFERIGLLPPIEHWWDRPYRKEDGSIVAHPSDLLNSN